jgi:hypothetical protein
VSLSDSPEQRFSVPFVEELTYILSVLDDRIDFENAKPLHVRLGDFECSLADGTLTATPTRRFAREEDARLVLESLLRAWEADAELMHHVRIEFAFSSIKLVRDESGLRTVGASLIQRAMVLEDAHVSRGSYPAPPNDALVTSPEFEVLRHRVRDLRQGRDRLLAVGNYVVTTLESLAGGKKNIESTFEIDDTVVRTLRTVTSNRAHAEHERKAGARTDLTQDEEAWVHAAIPLLVRRVGERSSGATMTRISMADLPQLPAT